MAKPNLRDLPEELVSNISLRLWSDDVQALRLTCKALEQKTLHEWATEYFSEKALIISTDSLKVLISLANSAKLRGFLRRMHLITAYFADSAFTCGKTCPYGHCCGWQPTVRQREAWTFFCKDQKDLKASGQDKEMLTEALRKLPALDDLTLGDSTSQVPISVDIRMLRKVARLCGRNFQMPCDSKNDAEYHQILSHAWTILTSAVANSGITTLTRFGTNLGKGSNSLCVPLDLRFSDTKINRLQNAFKNLTFLHMNITARLSRDASAKQGISAVGQLRLQKFAALLPPLHSLALDFDGKPSDNAIFSMFMQHLDLSKMTTLQLNSLTTDRKTMIAVFYRLTSIEDLLLNFVNLAKGSWIPLLKQLQAMTDHLEHLHLMYLLESGKKAYFLAQPDEDEQMDEEDMMFDDLLMGGAEDDFDEEDETDEDLPPLETMDGKVVGGDADSGPSSTSTAPLPAAIEDDEVPRTLQDIPAASTSTAPSVPTTTTKPPKPDAPKAGGPDYHASMDHKAPGNESCPERGYYVCLRGKEEIGKQLKTFVQEYNIGEDVYGGGTPPMGGMMGGGTGGGFVGGPMGGGLVGGAMTIPVPTGPGGQPPNVNNFLAGLAASLGVPPPQGQNGGAGAGAGAGAGGAYSGHHGGFNVAGAANANGANAAAGNMTNPTNGAQNHNAQAATGAPQGPAQGPGGASISFADFLAGAPPPPAGAGPAFGGAADDEWDTEGEGESSEFESESDE